MIALYEAIREALFIRSLSSIFSEHLATDAFAAVKGPIPIYEDNAQAFKHASEGFLRTDRNKHVDRKFMTNHDHVKSGAVDVRMVASADNLADLFTKTLRSVQHRKLSRALGLCSLAELTVAH
jgi:hypothetical protein